jgi:hypothetical protein
MEERVPTRPVSVRWIMTDPAFEAGARDIRAKRGFPADFDTWPTNTAWNYEQGRARAQRVSASVALKRDGRVTVEAVRWSTPQPRHPVTDGARRSSRACLDDQAPPRQRGSA